jgi:hypothetical protein
MKTSWLLILMAAFGTFTLGCGEGGDATPAPTTGDEAAAAEEAPAEEAPAEEAPAE